MTMLLLVIHNIETYFCIWYDYSSNPLTFNLPLAIIMFENLLKGQTIKLTLSFMMFFVSIVLMAWKSAYPGNYSVTADTQPTKWPHQAHPHPQPGQENWWWCGQKKEGNTRKINEKVNFVGFLKNIRIY